MPVGTKPLSTLGSASHQTLNTAGLIPKGTGSSLSQPADRLSQPFRSLNRSSQPLDRALGANSAELAKSRSRNAGKARRKIPTQPTLYNLTVSGITFYGNTAYPTSATTYTSSERFALTGLLSVQRTMGRGINYRNGRNAREIGLFLGATPFAGVGANPTAGAAWFATNNQVFRQAGGKYSQTAPLDVAFVTVKPNAGTIRIVIDYDAISTSSLLNPNFNAYNRNTATPTYLSPTRILVGDMQIRFQNGGKRVRGSIAFYGSEYNSPRATAYRATFVGTQQTV